eukprot:6063047-Prymnesium_polylepis.1
MLGLLALPERPVERKFGVCIALCRVAARGRSQGGVCTVRAVAVSNVWVPRHKASLTQYGRGVELCVHRRGAWSSCCSIGRMWVMVNSVCNPHSSLSHSAVSPRILSTLKAVGRHNV